ncbi:hypothetical protein POM88_053390 [Heracleum sosnowskyi]|uniref:Uncharacterized protein n=1 Tax=Heracleum sosnowskyi TaxID=360622 RepID=A0AAD8GQW1_9APIA|nr:hypothetical protein POM88_053390 [Heracleum sosnowskyi]
MKKLFLKIGYPGPILEEGTPKWYPSGEMDRKYLRKEWSMVFDAMVKVFSTKTTNWNGIPTYIKKLTHSLVHGYKVDVGKLFMEHLKAAIGKKVNIYPRFLILCINSLCEFDENAPRLEVCGVLKRNTHTTLTSLNLNAHIPLCFTKHMVDQVTNLGFPLPSGYATFTLEDEAGLYPNSANPHSIPYTQPRFSRLPKVQRQASQETRKRPLETDVGGSTESQEGVPTPSATNKEGSQTEPTVVPLEPNKKRSKRVKTTINHPAVSQKTVKEQRVVNTSLDVPSQQGTSIEIGLSPKAPCIESAQPHVPTQDEPPLAETHMESGHSEDFTSQVDASQVPFVEQPSLSSPLSPSSFPTHSFVSSPQPREGDSPNPPGFDHPSPIMDEPPSSGPQEPISQSEMDTTPSNTEKEQGATLLERETASTLFNLQGASYLKEDVVTASVAVKDSENVAVTGDPAVKDSVEVVVSTNPVVQAAVEPTVNLPTDNSISGKATVTSAQPDFDAVTIEDVSDDDVSLSQFLKVHSKPSFPLHVRTAHTHASRMSEGVQKKREALSHESSSVMSDEITQKNTESVRTPTSSMPHPFPSPPKRLRTGGPSTAHKLEALEHMCLSMETKLDSLFTMVASSFSSIQEAIQVLSASIDVANLPKGEKRARSEYFPKKDVASQGEPVSKEESRSKGEPAGETVLMSKEALEAMQGTSPFKKPVLPPVVIREPTSNPKENALEKKLREQEEQNRLGKGKDKLPEYILSGNICSEGTEFSQEEPNALMVDYRESTLHNHDNDFSRIVEEAMLEPSRRLSNCSTLLRQKIISVCVKINEEKRWAIDVYLDNGISMFITMQLLQSLPAKVLTVMKNKIKANHTSFNEIMHLQMLSLISEKLLEVYTNPLCVYYETTTKDGKRRCSYMSLGGTSTMESKAILLVLVYCRRGG